jgi:NADH:ubiquinone oxidoreductase subunit C
VTDNGAAGALSVLPEVPRLPDRSVSQLAFPHRETYVQMVRAFRDAGFETCADLCAVDYLTHPGRSLPDGVKAERFEVVVNLLSLSTPAPRPWSVRRSTWSGSSSRGTRTSHAF